MTTPDTPRYGFVGLGDMGAPMATHIVRSGVTLHGFDIAVRPSAQVPGIVDCASLEALVRTCDVVFVSVPDGRASRKVITDIARVTRRKTSVVIDLSTIGPENSATCARIAADAGIRFVDAPVSGGRIGAINATITLIWAGDNDILAAHRTVLGAFTGNIFHVGTRPGQGQAVKLLNNYLSAVSMIATSEAVLFGMSQGVDMKTILDVLNVSTGQNTATNNKFPKRILTGSYDAGFRTELMAKDVKIYLENVRSADSPIALADKVNELWTTAETTLPGSDFTRIFPFIGGLAAQDKDGQAEQDGGQ